jgi:hypothetical protein
MKQMLQKIRCKWRLSKQKWFNSLGEFKDYNLTIWQQMSMAEKRGTTLASMLELPVLSLASWEPMCRHGRRWPAQGQQRSVEPVTIPELQKEVMFSSSLRARTNKALLKLSSEWNENPRSHRPSPWDSWNINGEKPKLSTSIFVLIFFL